MSALQTQELLTAVVSLAREAASAILQVYDTDFTVDEKSDNSPLTAADRAAHSIIVDGLRKLTSHIPVLSEESESRTHEWSVRQRWHELWLVDPLDGTREFVQRNGEFAVNIALIRQHRAVLGVVLAPISGLAYFGAHELGSYRQKQQQEAERIRVRPTAEVPVVVGSRSHRDPALAELLGRIGPHALQSVGSALKFCLLAQGSADFYPRFGPTSEWDTAAGQAVLEAAGGHVMDLHGVPLRYNARPTLINPSFIAFGDETRDWRRFL